MSGHSRPEQEIVLGASTARDLFRQGRIRQVRLQNTRGETLIGAPVTIDVGGAVPAVFRAPVRAAASAIAQAARFVGLQIVIQRDE